MQIPSKVLLQICKEIEDAEAKHPGWPSADRFHQLTILQEEVGEVAKVLLDDNNAKSILESVNLNKELAQVAAMAIRMMVNP